VNARLLTGQTLNMVEYAQAGSLMVRIAARIGINRRPRTVESTETLEQYCARISDWSQASSRPAS
jgi:hypothetical protein